MECWFPASDGTGTIGTNFLANLRPTADGGIGALSVWNQSRTTFDAGGFMVDFIATEQVTNVVLEVQ